MMEGRLPVSEANTPPSGIVAHVLLAKYTVASPPEKMKQKWYGLIEHTGYSSREQAGNGAANQGPKAQLA